MSDVNVCIRSDCKWVLRDISILYYTKLHYDCACLWCNYWWDPFVASTQHRTDNAYNSFDIYESLFHIFSIIKSIMLYMHARLYGKYKTKCGCRHRLRSKCICISVTVAGLPMAATRRLCVASHIKNDCWLVYKDGNMFVCTRRTLIIIYIWSNIYGDQCVYYFLVFSLTLTHTPLS